MLLCYIRAFILLHLEHCDGVVLLVTLGLSILLGPDFLSCGYYAMVLIVAIQCTCWLYFCPGYFLFLVIST